MPDTRLRSDALADDALAFLKPLVGWVWLGVASIALANACSTGPVMNEAPAGLRHTVTVPFAGERW